MFKKLNFVQVVTFLDHPGQHIVMSVICVYKDLIIIVLGWEVVSERETINIFSVIWLVYQRC
jgi:hypothetical protein